MSEPTKPTATTETETTETETRCAAETAPATETFQLPSIRKICENLSKPIADRHLRKRKQGGKDLLYISWFDATKYLDHHAPGWSYEIRRMDNIAGKLILTVRISILCAEGIVFREATGQEDEEYDTYGNASSNAESMALRRAAAKFGLGRSLYSGGGK